MNIVIITGASSGIGREFARQMDRSFASIDQFWLVARSRDKLEEVAESLQHESRIFAMDVTSNVQLERLEGAVRKSHAKIRVLVNCAGYGIMGSFAEQNRKEETGMIRLNCEALTNITHRMIPYMRRGSRIIQLSSCAAFLPQSDFAVYAASKAYVLRFSQAIGEELRERGIYVTSVCPGPVDTPFFDIAEQHGRTLSIKKYTMVRADQVVRKALKDSLHRRAKSVYSLPIKGVELLSKVLPHEFALKCMHKMKV
ncbi:MAG: SDR family NAD(P)-dependent oxidoreductase [Muribaculum sp.]|nr:SDR family NAD(P)-dependent oxidoreductase [Muribaculum sp.]